MEFSDTPEDNFSEIIRLELPATHRHINLVGACVTALLEREDRLQDRDRIIQEVQLAIHETCANIVEHAYLNAPGRILVNLVIKKDPKLLVVDLYDTGIPFDLTTFHPSKVEGPQVRGYGLSIIHQLMENVTYVVESQANHWRLEKNL